MASSRRGRLGVARGRLPCLGLEGGDGVEEELVGGKLLPKEEEEIGVVQLVGVVLRCPPVVLRRGGASMVRVEEGELLHGFARDRKSVV